MYSVCCFPKSSAKSKQQGLAYLLQTKKICYVLVVAAT